jgi:ATP-dependent DNA helicase RecQ
VYAPTRKAVDSLTDLIRGIGISAIAYHAGMSAQDRERQQDAFMQERARVVVATCAFGMGIDKPNVRLVAHYAMSGSLEAYYQEAGRASRDGAPGRCVLLHAVGDRQVHDFMIDQSHPPRELIETIVTLLSRERSLRAHDIALVAARGAGVAPRQAEAVLRILRRQDVLRESAMGPLVLDGVIDWDDGLGRRRHEIARLDAMDAYARTRECRRGFVLRYFGDPEVMASCGDCDNCQAATGAPPVAPTPAAPFSKRC